MFTLLAVILLCIFLPFALIVNHNTDPTPVNRNVIEPEIDKMPEQHIRIMREYIVANNVQHSDAKVALCITGSRLEVLIRALPEYVRMIRQPVHVFVYGHVYMDNLPSYMLHNSDTFMIVPPEDFKGYSNPGPCQLRMNNMIQMLKNIMHGANMVRAYEDKIGVKYDWVIRIRPDLILYSVIDVDTLNYVDENNEPTLIERQTNTIYFPAKRKYIRMDDRTGIEDQLFMGDSDTMYNFCQAYNYVGTVDGMTEYDCYAERFLLLYAKYYKYALTPFALRYILLRISKPGSDGHYVV